MGDTFPLKNRSHAVREIPEDRDDDLSLEFLISKPASRAEITRVTDAGPGADVLDVLIFALAVCLWMTSIILVGIHIIGGAVYSESYSAMVKRKYSLVLIVLQLATVLIGILSAFCTSSCIYYKQSAHGAHIMSKVAIGLFSANIGLFVCLLSLAWFGWKHSILYAAAIPILVLIMVKSSKIVREHSNERALAKLNIAPSEEAKDYEPRKVRFSGQPETNIEDIARPEIEPPKKSSSPFISEADLMRDAVMQVMSEDLSGTPSKNSPPKRSLRRRDVNDDSSSSPDPKSTSPSYSGEGFESSKEL